MDKHALVLFADVVEQGSFAAAARLNNLPTTSVSRSIQQLEAQLSGRLLNRTTRSLSLTELGEQVLPKAQLLRETISQVAGLAEQQLERPSGRLKISATRSYALSVLQPWLAEFNVAFPDIDLILDLSNHYVDLNAAGIDFAFRLGPLKDSSIIALPIHTIRYRLVASKRYLSQCKSSPTHPNELTDYSLIQGHINGTAMTWNFVEDNKKFALAPTGSISVDDLTMAASLVNNHVGIGYLPDVLLQTEVKTGEIIELLPSFQAAPRPMYLVYPDRQFLPNKSQCFIEFVRGKAKH